MAPIVETEALESWEKMMACCFSCGFVWFKKGCGSTCCLNVVLQMFCGICCAHICHACSYVGEPAAIESPCAVIAVHGELRPITTQPR